MTRTRKKVQEAIPVQPTMESNNNQIDIDELKSQIKKEVKEESMQIVTALLTAGLLAFSGITAIFYMPIFFGIVAFIGCMHSAYKAISTSKPAIQFLKNNGILDIKIER